MFHGGGDRRGSASGRLTGNGGTLTPAVVRTLTADQTAPPAVAMNQ